MGNIYILIVFLMSLILLVASKTVDRDVFKEKRKCKNKSAVRKKISEAFRSGNAIVIALSFFVTGCVLSKCTNGGFKYGSDICFAVSLLLYLAYAFFAGKDIGKSIKFLLSILNTVFSSAIWLLIVTYARCSQNISVPAFVLLTFLTFSLGTSAFDVWTGMISFITGLYEKNEKNAEAANTILGVAVSAATLVQMSYSFYKIFPLKP